MFSAKNAKMSYYTSSVKMFTVTRAKIAANILHKDKVGEFKK